MHHLFLRWAVPLSPHRMDRRRSTALLAALLLIAPAACRKTPVRESGATTVEVQVITLDARSTPVSWEFVGTVEALRTVEIRSRVAGELIKRPFTEGKKIKQGEVLFVVDPAPFDAAIKSAEGRLASAQARREGAKRDVARLAPLVERGAATPRELDDAISQEQQSAAAILTAQGDLDRAKLERTYTTISAPFDGLVGKTFLDEGAYVEPGGQGILAVVTQQDPISVTFNVSERLLMSIREQVESGRLTEPPDKTRAIELLLSDGSLYRHRGQVNFVDVVYDRDTGSAVMRAQFPNPQRELFPGQFVKPRIVGLTRPNSLSVPQRSVLLSPAGSFVYVVNAQDMVEARSVRLGEWSGSDWIIESGLTSGERVVVEGLQRVQPGMKVRVTGGATTQSTTRESNR